MSRESVHDAVSAGVFDSEDIHAELLRSIVAVARAIFRAEAASVLLLDEASDELVFEAVSGAGEDRLVGQRFPSGAGVAGFVLVTGQSLIIDDLASDARFAKDVAAETGYVPDSLMAVPLLYDEQSLGVLEVLDRQPAANPALAEIELLGLFANQAAVALTIVQRVRRARAALRGQDPRSAALTKLAFALDGVEGERESAYMDLLQAIGRLVEIDT